MGLSSQSAVIVPAVRPDPRRLRFVRRRAVILAEKCPLDRSNSSRPHLEMSIPRRDAVACMAASLVANFCLTEPAEARRIKPETRRRIREKLDKMKEKGSVTNKDSPGSSAEEKKLPPSILNNLAGPLVEVGF